MMDWNKLLSSKRLGKTTPDELNPARSPFEQDFDRIVFSAAFRRLQDKTQVFPLAESDYVRTRLTHSLEVSRVARSLGAAAGAQIIKKHNLHNIQPGDFGAICAAAALAHDIGNPPLGHSGEEAIRHYFCNSKLLDSLSEAERMDIEKYEGNAQGFRLLTRLEMDQNHGGMQLTCATLGAFMKYPGASNGIYKKFNYFQHDRENFAEVAQTVGLKDNGGASCCRHPLSYLVEAADDICYLIVDFEDARKLKILSSEEFESPLQQIIKSDKSSKRLEQIKSPAKRAEFLRARALGTLISEAVECFMKHEDTILAGEQHAPLTDLMPSGKQLARIREKSVKDIYNLRRNIEIEVAGFELTEGLLCAFANCVTDSKKSFKNKKLLQLIPSGCQPQPDDSRYVKLLKVLDFISGMTDSYAVSLFKKIKGISLPGQ